MVISRFLITLSFLFLFSYGSRDPLVMVWDGISRSDQSGQTIVNKTLYDSIADFSGRLEEELRRSRIANAEKIVPVLERLLIQTNSLSPKTIAVSDACYLLGYYFNSKREIDRAVDYYKECISIRDSISSIDSRYARCLENLGLIYYGIGDLKLSSEYLEEALFVQGQIYGEDSPEMASTMINLAASYLRLKKFTETIKIAERGLILADNSTGMVPANEHAAFLQSIGTAYSIMADYSRALVYLNQSKAMYLSTGLTGDINYFRLLNDMANSYWGVSDLKGAKETFEEALSSFSGKTETDYLIMLDNYANLLWRMELQAEADKNWKAVLKTIKEETGELSPIYNRICSNYAYFLSTVPERNKVAAEMAETCFTNSVNGDFNVSDRMTVTVNFARVLRNTGEVERAVKLIRELEQQLLSDSDTQTPDSTHLPWVDLGSLRMYEFWYSCEVQMWRERGEIDHMKSAAIVSGKLISQIEELRLEMGEEESRLILGERSALDYKNAVESATIVYKATGEKDYATKAFDFSERSKVSVLLAATRELKATQLHVPVELSSLLSEVQAGIAYYRALIAEGKFGPSEKFKTRVDITDLIFSSIITRDSLISIIEKRYPGYYSLKYDRHTVAINELADRLGRKRNYISYVLCDTMLYTFVVNKHIREIVATPVDKNFYSDIDNFRNAVSFMPSGVDARRTFENYNSIGGHLHTILIDPIKEYIHGEDLIISPDNLLSYIPFEALTKKVEYSDGITFRDLPYLMKEYEISYTYSASLLEDNRWGVRNFVNRSVSFAPMYTRNLSRDSILSTRQVKSDDGLRPLPYSLEESLYITEVCNGDLFLNNEASESAFKEAAGRYPIVHLAMHTLVNDADPMYSKMIFSPNRDSGEDGQLNTYEIYSLTIPAKMVVLSSCNTGSGKLNSGEGVMSLARGFMYAGSKSVVMALWEVEDRTGTGIVRGFFTNLHKGLSKGAAMRKARMDYLEVATQQRSHPYYWATLVVIGENNPIFFDPFWLILIASILLVSSLSGYFYLRYRSRS